MSSSTLYRLSGLALLLGAVFGIIGQVLGSLLFSSDGSLQSTNPLGWGLFLVFNIGSLLLLVGMPGICVRQAAQAGWLGFVGFVLAFIGMFMLTSSSFTNLLIVPWLAQVAPKVVAQGDGPPALFVFFLMGNILFAVGGILLGIATLHARILPRFAGLFLLSGTILNLVSFPLNGSIGNIVGTVAIGCVALGLGWMGYALLSVPLAIEVQPASASAEVPV